MNFGLKAIVAVSLTCLTQHAFAQTLTERLLAENPKTLVEQAQSNGDIVRGAILFHQGNINCAKCHRPSAERERMGPDLSRIDPGTSDEMIVESILQPSRVIKQGYETTIILGIDGQVVYGMVLEEDDQRVILRDAQEIDRILTIPREEIDEMRPGTLSSMPANLADELKDRQQFLDLLRYVLDVRERGPTSGVEIADSSARRELSAELNGLVRVSQLNCVACHDPAGLPQVISAKQAPRLAWSAKWLNPEWMERFVRNPHEVKPGTTMPDVLGHLPEPMQSQSANAITHFLVSRAGNRFEGEPISQSAVDSGFDLFHSVGCAACHSPRNRSSVEAVLADSIPLGDLSFKYNASGLVQFLENPLINRPSGHMPNMQLTHREATDIAHFLLQGSGSASGKWQLDPDLVEQGSGLFAKHRCASCHTDWIEDETSSKNAGAWNNLSADRGCLSGQIGDWPDFQLSESQRREIQTALTSTPINLTNHQQIDVSLKLFNCVACHDRDTMGGVTPERSPHFQTTDMNLGEQGRIPPTLTGVGAKLRTKWIRDVMVNRRSIRPYMLTRMPQFGEENIGHLFELFKSSDQLPEIEFAAFEDQEFMRKNGLKLAGNEGLNCVACHTYQYKLSDTMPAVDLTEMAERLEKDWFYHYMLAPQQFSPNTVMPSFWPNGQAIRKDIDGSPAEQIESLWQYLIDGRQANMPRGVVREPLEIVVSEEAQMLRRSYPGIGKRGIGVGYPGGVNLAFDAEQMRLAMVWQGKFADPAGVWTGQGSGNVSPLGKPIHFITGPDLDDRQHPWIVDDGRPPRHQFQGYTLDALRRPAFRYRFDSVEVVDYFMEVVDEESQSTHLRRVISLSAPGNEQGTLRFRIGSAERITADGDAQYSLGEGLQVQIISGPTPNIVESVEQGQQLELPVDLATATDEQWILEYQWK